MGFVSFLMVCGHKISMYFNDSIKYSGIFLNILIEKRVKLTFIPLVL